MFPPNHSSFTLFLNYSHLPVLLFCIFSKLKTFFHCVLAFLFIILLYNLLEPMTGKQPGNSLSSPAVHEDSDASIQERVKDSWQNFRVIFLILRNIFNEKNDATFECRSHEIIIYLLNWQEIVLFSNFYPR